MRLASLSSGSKGNCIFIEEKDTSVLVDIGISKKRVEDGLCCLHRNVSDVSGIVITHEHSDHVKGLGVFLRKYNIPVFATEKTFDALMCKNTLGNINTSLFHVIKPYQCFHIKDLELMPLHTSHDAADPVCYRFNTEDNSCAVVTDLGEYDTTLIKYLQNLSAILVEANHDVGMLQAGSYPYYLKQRIWGNKGHLSNETCGSLLNNLLNKKLKHIVLGHLSEENNYPELAFQSVRNEINFSENDYNADDFNIKVASRTEPSCMIEF